MTEKVLSSYDPHWADRLELAHANLDESHAVHYDRRLRRTMVSADCDELSAAFNSQFRTTAAYVAFFKQNSAKLYGFTPVLPELPDGTEIAEADEILYELVNQQHAAQPDLPIGNDPTVPAFGTGADTDRATAPLGDAARNARVLVTIERNPYGTFVCLHQTSIRTILVCGGHFERAAQRVRRERLTDAELPRTRFFRHVPPIAAPQSTFKEYILHWEKLECVIIGQVPLNRVPHAIAAVLEYDPVSPDYPPLREFRPRAPLAPRLRR